MIQLKHIRVWWTAFAAVACMFGDLSRAEPTASHPLTVEGIRCKGTLLTTCDYVRGFVHIEPGSSLDEREIQDARLRLSSLPAYASVRIYLDKGSARGRAVVVVEVVEADRVENQYLAGTAARLSSIYQTLEGRVAEHDVFGTDATVNLDAEGIVPFAGPDHHGVYTRLQVAKPTVLDCIQCFVIAGVTYQNTVTSYPYGSFDDTDQLGIDWNAGYRLFDYSYVTIGYLARVISQSVSGACQ